MVAKRGTFDQTENRRPQDPLPLAPLDSDTNRETPGDREKAFANDSGLSANQVCSAAPLAKAHGQSLTANALRRAQQQNGTSFKLRPGLMPQRMSK